MLLAVWIAVWAVGIVGLYFVSASVALAFGLGWLLTAGNVDWSGETRKAPTDPITIGYRGDPRAAFGYEFETIHYPTELGDAEAWLIPAAEPSSTWAIFVHGIGGIRENGYRMTTILHEAGISVLMITYRNDKGAPVSTDRLYSFGLSEWRDLDAAVGWAGTRGVGKIIIVAESMGAAITGQYLANAADTSSIAGLVFDAPALDFNAIIKGGGRHYWVPLSEGVAATGLWLSRFLRTDLTRAVSMDAVVGFDGPIFVAHGTRDPLVPFEISERLTAARPDTFFVPTEADRHPLSYEADPEGYKAGLLRLVDAVRARP